MVYKTRVPVRGAIMLNTAMDQVVLVKGWKSGSSWSFPRGKIDKNEDDLDCAVREVLEETGYNLAGMVHEGDHVEINMREQNMRLYIATGVPEETVFQPKTRKEISVSRKSLEMGGRWNWADAGCRKSLGISSPTCLGIFRRKEPRMKSIKCAAGNIIWLHHLFESCESGSQPEVNSCSRNNKRKLFLISIVWHRPPRTSLQSMMKLRWKETCSHHLLQIRMTLLRAYAVCLVLRRLPRLLSTVI